MSSYEEECIAEECLEPAERERRILEAVKEGDVGSLKILLNSLEWYKVKDQDGLPLLAIAAAKNSREVFDYLLSVPNYPQEALDDALKHTLSDEFCNAEDNMREYYACELIERGADVLQERLLYNALSMDLFKIAERLIEKGALNELDPYEPKTTLDFCCIYYKEVDMEGIAMLLFYGADPIDRARGEDCEAEFSSFDLLLQHSVDSFTSDVEDFYSNYIFGVHTDYDIDVEAFLKATELDDWIFRDITQNIREVTFSFSFEGCSIVDYVPILFTMKTDMLQIIIQKFDYVVKRLLSERYRPFNTDRKTILVKNLDVLMKSHLKKKFINWLFNVNGGYAAYFIEIAYDSSNIEEAICFLLSHGIRVLEIDLQAVYDKFGYCELFKILLHMDVGKSHRLNSIVPYILYNVTLDIPKMVLDENFELPTQFMIRNKEEFAECLRELLPYYTIPVDLLRGGDTLESVEYEPRVPLLVELARNIFRRYFIERLNIMNSRQFYTLVKKLPITNYHKQIITLEVKLY